MSDWLILRTSGRTTLPLAQSLAASGFEVWTPVFTQRFRVPRANARRVVTSALLKGFVFGSYKHRHDLLEIANGRGCHARFSIMADDSGGVASIPDRELDGLRWIEAKTNVTAKKAHRTIPQGVAVRVSTGLFSGMVGVVRRCKRGITLVCFNDRYSVEIPTSLLEEDRAYRLQSATGGPVALAA